MEESKTLKFENKKFKSVSSMIVWKNKMFLFFVFALMIIYIGNVQYSEYRIRKAQLLEKEVTQLKWTLTNMQSGMSFNGLEVQVSKKVSEKQLIIKSEVPKVIIQGIKN